MHYPRTQKISPSSICHDSTHNYPCSLLVPFHFARVIAFPLLLSVFSLLLPRAEPHEITSEPSFDIQSALHYSFGHQEKYDGGLPLFLSGARREFPKTLAIFDGNCPHRHSPLCSFTPTRHKFNCARGAEDKGARLSASKVGCFRGESVNAETMVWLSPFATLSGSLWQAREYGGRRESDHRSEYYVSVRRATSRLVPSLVCAWPNNRIIYDSEKRMPFLAYSIVHNIITHKKRAISNSRKGRKTVAKQRNNGDLALSSQGRTNHPIAD